MSIQVLSAEQFRQKLAGFVDPERELGEAEQQALREETVRFLSVLASLFGDELDRVTLWDRIASGCAVALAKSGYDWERFVNAILEHIKAAPGKVAACDALVAFLEVMRRRPRDVQAQFLRLIETRRLILIVQARARWQQVKAGEVEL